MNKKLIFDAHTHLNDDHYYPENFEVKQIISDAKQVGVGYFLNCGYSLESSKVAIKQAYDNEDVYVAIGIHPNDISNHRWENLDQLDQLAKNKKVVAIGEVGLDYFYQKEDRLEQIKWFEAQIKLAIKNDLTLMMHIRDEKNVYQAYDDVIEILKKLKPKKMIVHCFSANLEYAKKFIDLGSYINIGGAVTFKNAKELQQAVTWIPLEKMLVETDAPYLTPHPHRGKTNFPKYIVLTVEKIAELKNVSLEQVIEQTTTNAFEIFNIK